MKNTTTTRRALLLAAVMAGGLAFGQPAASRDAEPTPEKLELRYQGWNSLVLYPELAEALGYLAPIRLKWIGNTISGPQDIQATVTGDVDFGGAFNGSIIKLHAARAPVKAVIAYLGIDEATNGGVFSVESGPIRSARDLVGRKIGVNTLGAYQEYVINSWLEQSGLSAEDIRRVTLVAAPPVNLAQLLRAGQLDAVFLQDLVKDKLLSEGGVRALVNDQQLLGSRAFASYVLTDRFIERYPETARRFVEGTARAIEWAQTTPREEVVARLRQIVAARQRNEEQNNVQFWRSASLDAPGGLIQRQDFATYVEWYRKNGQLPAGQVKPEEVFTNRFNPFQSRAQAQADAQAQVRAPHRADR